MKNRHIGILILFFALVVFLIVLSFNSALESIVNETCTHGPSCPMYTTLGVQKTISYSLMSLFLLSGLYLVFFAKEADLSLAKRKLPKNVTLDNDERKIIDELKNHDGSAYQSDLIAKTGFSKVKTSRVLDRLEGKGLIERKRRGMTNIVIMK